VTTVELADGRRAVAVNAMGRLFMDALDSPFRLTAQELAELPAGPHDATPQAVATERAVIRAGR
jgi:hypothetical protein